MIEAKPATLETQLSAQWGEPNTAGVSIPRELTFENVSLSIEGTSIIDDISLVAPSGSVTCLLGPSGSGKTSLLRIAAGMTHQSAGRVLLDDWQVCGGEAFVPPEKRGIGLVFQDYALFPHLSILDNVLFGLRHLPRDARKPQAMKMLSRVGLADRGSDHPHTLSGGEQQRVALARALAPRPGVLLMDEPFSGLDSRLRDMMRDETLGILRETLATSVIVTHDPEEALRMGDQIALLHEGRLAQTGTGRELYYQPKSLFAAGFFSELNLFEGRVEGDCVDTPMGKIACKGFDKGAAVIAAVRVGATRAGRSVTNAQAKGLVLSSHFSGEHEQIQVGINGYDRPITLLTPAGTLTNQQLNGAKEVGLSFDKQGAFVFSAG